MKANLDLSANEVAVIRQRERHDPQVLKLLNAYLVMRDVVETVEATARLKSKQHRAEARNWPSTSWRTGSERGQQQAYDVIHALVMGRVA